MSRKRFIIVLGIIAAAIMLEILAGYFAGKAIEKTWDVCYEMTNTKISWEQTFHPGVWGE